MGINDAARTSLLGLAVGDAFGTMLDRTGADLPAHAAKRLVWPHRPWRWTDDTAMALSVVEVLERHGQIDVDALAAAFARRFAEEPGRGYGAGAYGLLSRVGLGVPWREEVARMFGGKGSYGSRWCGARRPSACRCELARARRRCGGRAGEGRCDAVILGPVHTRREMLRLGLAGLASVGLGSAVAGCRDRAAPVRPGRPRYFVTILLSGGIDPIWTTDPRARGEVEAGIDVPYEPRAIVEAGALRFGPHLAALAPVADRLSVINGVQTGTANHNWGWLQFDRLRTRVDDRMPVIGSLLGERRDGQPLAVLQLPADDATLVRAERASAEDRRAMAAALERQRQRLGGERGGGPAGRSLAAAAALLDRMATASAFAAAPWTDATRPMAVNLQQDLQRALWAIENDLVACCQVSVDRYGQPWDSHWDNHRVQASTSRSTIPLIARFLRELGERRNAHGVLADQTLVVLGSELGRFPRLNGAQGKDHWPEAPFLFWGAGIVPQQRFGDTGAHLEARPVSLRTGRAVAAGGELVTLDDIGATLLDLAGVDPAPRGYLGRRLDFLVAA